MSKICTISTIKASLRETLMFVYYHLNVGVDQIIIFFDDPNDKAADYLQDFERVTCVRCDDFYWKQNGGTKSPAIEDRQVINNNNGLVMARDRGFQWAIFIDNDELVYTDSSLKDILSRINGDVIRFKIYEAVSEKEHYDSLFDTALFKTSARSIQIKAAMLLGCKRAFFEGRYFRGHMDSKVAVRVNADIIKMYIHGPQLSEKGIVERKTNKIKLLHYDCVGIDAWKSKRLGRLEKSSVKGLRGHIKKQQELFASALSRDGAALHHLYRENYIIPKFEQKILRLLNMLAYVHIDKKLFERPKEADICS